MVVSCVVAALPLPAPTVSFVFYWELVQPMQVLGLAHGVFQTPFVTAGFAAEASGGWSNRTAKSSDVCH